MVLHIMAYKYDAAASNALMNKYYAVVLTAIMSADYGCGCSYCVYYKVLTV